MKLKGLCALLLILLLPTLTAFAQDEPETCDLVYVFDAWAHPSPEGAPTSAVYGLLVNLSAEADTLVSASTTAAEVVELHEIIMGAGDVMQMRPVEGGFGVAPGSYTELKPGGYHIMLIDLTAPLVAGEMIDLTLTFEQAGQISLSVPIRDAASMAAPMTGEIPVETETPMSEPAQASGSHPWGEACRQIYMLDAWVRPAGAGMPTSAAYGLLLNLTSADDQLISAAASAAETVELHEMIMGAGDVMRMRPLADGITLLASEITRLQPGGLHIMLINLTRELHTGDMVEITLTFAHSDPQTLRIPVRDPDAEMTGMEGHG